MDTGTRRREALGLRPLEPTPGYLFALMIVDHYWSGFPKKMTEKNLAMAKTQSLTYLKAMFYSASFLLTVLPYSGSTKNTLF